MAGAQKPEVERACPKCGQRVFASDLQCITCGARLRAPGPPAPREPEFRVGEGALGEAARDVAGAVFDAVWAVLARCALWLGRGILWAVWPPQIRTPTHFRMVRAGQVILCFTATAYFLVSLVWGAASIRAGLLVSRSGSPPADGTQAPAELLDDLDQWVARGVGGSLVLAGVVIIALALLNAIFLRLTAEVLQVLLNIDENTRARPAPQPPGDAEGDRQGIPAHCRFPADSPVTGNR